VNTRVLPLACIVMCPITGYGVGATLASSTVVGDASLVDACDAVEAHKSSSDHTTNQHVQPVLHRAAHLFNLSDASAQ